jgi:hypothetical protein
MLQKELLPWDHDPTGHAVHTAEDVAAVTPDIVPAEHSEQSAYPACEYEPGQHVWHVVLPSVDA